MVIDQQVRRLMDEINKHGQLGRAARRANMDRKTARKYAASGQLPSAMSTPRTWRTRENPFEADWAAMAAMLSDAPELEGKALFEFLMAAKPGRYQPGQLRTFQRLVKRWRATSGPDKEVFFSQLHKAGEALQTDFTHGTELGVTLRTEPFPHLLCHVVLPCSNWQWATICRSESMAALRKGIQAALFRLGRVPTWHQTDNSTAATHDLPGGKRGFNNDYVDLVEHFGMKPRTTGVGKKEQNGDVESLNGALKRGLKQHLLLRGSSDFDTVADYQRWLEAVVDAANALRADAGAAELAHMRPLVASRLVEYTVTDVRVTTWSTIRVKHNAYSVPSRLIGERLRVHAYDDRLDVFFAQKLQLSLPRMLGRNGHRVNYRHVIWSLVRKPGAFQRYRYREDLFPSVAFRHAYDALCAHLGHGRSADLAYLRVLHLAASTMESDVELALQVLRDEGVTPTMDELKSLLTPEKPATPMLEAPTPDLTAYDALLLEVGR